MKVLVCGSSGCVGQAVVHSLRARGHRVVETRHDAASTGKLSESVLPLDFMTESSPSRWADALREARIEGVVNCVGACLPVVSLPGGGRQRVQPIHVFELAECIVRLLEQPSLARGVLELGGRASIGYHEMLATYRSALGLGEPLWLSVPLWAMRAGARVAELLPQRVFSRETLRLLERGNTTMTNAADALLGRAPAALAEGLVVTPPAPAFDLRVVLGAPLERLLRWALAFLWLQTALVSAVLPHESGVLALLARCGLTGDAGTAALAFSCILNAALGFATLLRPGAFLCALQAGAIVGYTATAAWHVPALTIDHCGPLAKNVPLLACVVLLWLAHASTHNHRGPASANRAPSCLSEGGQRSGREQSFMRPCVAKETCEGSSPQTSMFATRSALPSMKLRRGSTSSPISIVNTRSASIASSSWTRRSLRTAGSIVVSQSCSGFISPSPL